MFWWLNAQFKGVKTWQSCFWNHCMLVISFTKRYHEWASSILPEASCTPLRSDGCRRCHFQTMVKSWRCNLAMQKGQIWDRNRQFYTEKCERCLLQIVFWVEMLRLVVIPHYTADSAAEISLKRSARTCGTLLCARQFFHPDLSLRLRIFLCRCTLISPRRSRTVFFLGLKSIQLSHASNGNRPLSTIFGMTVHLLSRFVWCFPLSE